MEENEWEAIQFPSSSTGGDSTQSEDDVVLVNNVFPPTNHEGLPPSHHFYEPIPATSSPPPPVPPPPSYLSSTSSLNLTPTSSSSLSGILEEEDDDDDDDDEIRLPYQQEPETTDRSGILRFVSGIYGRFGVWSFVSVAVAVLVAAYARRWQRLRSSRKRLQREKMDQMMLLINQKDEKIKQLLIQINQMNEVLSARKRVPVHRIVIDRPIMNRPRLDWKPT